ncbi:MAG: hypothetical protein ACFFAQ_16285 [Promethearchaeota archaeon]
MDDKLKIKLGAIFLSIGIITLVIFLTPAQIPDLGATVLFIIVCLIFLPPVGYGLLMAGLSYRNKGIMLIINGIVFMIPMWIHGIFLIGNPIQWMDLITIIYIILHLFLALIFIFPGIYLIYTNIPNPKTEYNSSLLGWTIGISILTLICTTLVTVVGGVIATSAHDMNFRVYFFRNFGYCLGVSFLISSLLIGLSYIFRGAGVSGASVPSGASLPTS